MIPETESEELVSMKISEATRDFLKKAKDQLGVGSIDAAIQRLFEVANRACYITDEYVRIPCDADLCSCETYNFSYAKCPTFCPRYKNVKSTQTWDSLLSYGLYFTKEAYINFQLKRREEEIKRSEKSHQGDPKYTLGNWEYDLDHKPLPSREILEARFKRNVEDNKKEVLELEKARKIPLFSEWAKIWNYPACVEGIKDVKDPEEDEP